MLDGAVTGDACVTEGTVTISRNGEVYTMDFLFGSDAGYDVVGRFEGELNLNVAS